MESKKKSKGSIGPLEQPKELIKQLIGSDEGGKTPKKSKKSSPINLNNNAAILPEVKVITNHSPVEKPDTNKSQIKSRMAS